MPSSPSHIEYLYFYCLGIYVAHQNIKEPKFHYLVILGWKWLVNDFSLSFKISSKFSSQYKSGGNYTLHGVIIQYSLLLLLFG